MSRVVHYAKRPRETKRAAPMRHSPLSRSGQLGRPVRRLAAFELLPDPFCFRVLLELVIGNLVGVLQVLASSRVQELLFGDGMAHQLGEFRALRLPRVRIGLTTVAGW